jgi:acetolactate synthase-1/2/3 large subunit
VPRDLIGTDAFQETDMVGISRPVVKHSFMVRDASEIPGIVKKAFHIATTGRPGPVVIDVPKDTTDPAETFAYDYPDSVNLRSYRPAYEGDMDQVKIAVAAILAANRPVFYVGGGVIQADAKDSLRALVRAVGAPVASTLMGLGAYPGTDKLSLGMLGMHGTYEANMAMDDADLVIALGARFDDRVTNNPDKFSPKAKIIHMDIDPASIDKIIDSHIALVGDAQWVIEAIWAEYQSQVKARSAQQSDGQAEHLADWWQQLDGWRKDHGLNHALKPEQGKAILPQLAVQTLYRVTKGEAFVSSDVGQHQMFAAQYYHFDEPRRWINSGGLGTMGFGLPAAMGVQMGSPDAVVACVTGEGSFMMNMQELSTCLQYGLPIKIINLNNQALGMVKQWQDMQYGGRHSQSSYSDSLPDFKTLVEAFGHVGVKVSDATELDAAMEWAFSEENKNRLVFVDVWVDPHEHVYPMAIKGGGMRDMILSKTQTVGSPS